MTVTSAGTAANRDVARRLFSIMALAQARNLSTRLRHRSAEFIEQPPRWGLLHDR